MKLLQILTTLALISALASPALAAERLRLATTTSTEASGLLRVLLPPFEQRHQVKVDVIAVGTGKALKLAEMGDVDAVLVHAPALEEAFVAAGHGVQRHPVMYNDFVILGPAADPAGIAAGRDALEALQRIAARQSVFVSRGDESGTHQMERQLWQAAGISPGGRWYLEAGRGMGEVIAMATERRAYTLTDRGTWLALRGRSDLQVLVEGDERLFNPYGVIAVNPQRHPHVQAELARVFIDYLLSAEGQERIRSFKVGGEPLFFTDEGILAPVRSAH